MVINIQFIDEFSKKVFCAKYPADLSHAGASPEAFVETHLLTRQRHHGYLSPQRCGAPEFLIVSDSLGGSLPGSLVDALICLCSLYVVVISSRPRRLLFLERFSGGLPGTSSTVPSSLYRFIVLIVLRWDAASFQNNVSIKELESLHGYIATILQTALI